MRDRFLISLGIFFIVFGFVAANGYFYYDYLNAVTPIMYDPVAQKETLLMAAAFFFFGGFFLWLGLLEVPE